VSDCITLVPGLCIPSEVYTVSEETVSVTETVSTVRYRLSLKK